MSMFTTIRVVVPLLFALTSSVASVGQQPVPAPHNPVPPRLPDSPPPSTDMVPRYLRGGLWMTDPYTRSSIYLRNNLETASLPVSPVLYLSNGVKITAPTVTLEPNGTAVISINDTLANQGISPNAILSGYVELQYQWPWDPICATVSSIDVTHSVIFTYGLSSVAPSSQKYKAGNTRADAASGPQTLEGAWWKQEAGVTGFVTLSNTTGEPLPATLQVTDTNAAPLGYYQVTVSPHGTKRVDLQELAVTPSGLGGLRVRYNGAPDAVIANGSLEDLGKGYSASIPFAPPPLPSAKTMTLNYAEIGLMIGAMDPMMHFPASTVFTPYSVLRNIGTQPATITPVLYWMEGGTARSARQSAITLGPLQANSLDVISLMNHSGLNKFNGLLNLVLEIHAPQDSVLLSSGSVDQTYTYVFEVIPNAAKVSGSKDLGYWSTANGDDTMVTMWNPADEAQDFIFTIFFTGGHYLLPVHLGPRAAYMFNVSQVVEAQTPDSEGDVIPLAVHDGSAQISGARGENQLILVSVDVATYNSKKATCSYRCITCNGAVTWYVAGSPFTILSGSSTQLSFLVNWNSGRQYNITPISTWNSSATNIATVSAGVVHGVSEGSVTMYASDNTEPWYGQSCGAPPMACPVDWGVDSSGAGNVQVPTYFFSPSATQTSTPALCTQEGGKGYFLDLSYYVADGNNTRVSQSGMAPGENLGNGSGWHDAFATPTTTRSDGSFDDTPNGGCFVTSGHFCAAGYPQSFRLTADGTVFPISTNTTRRECTDGIQLVIQGNPAQQNKTYTFGNTQ